jgi:hypothetical protein
VWHLDNDNAYVGELHPDGEGRRGDDSEYALRPVHREVYVLRVDHAGKKLQQLRAL